ncbi:MAG: hypothetical protein K2W96_00320 [Gemmataceae bacterium]|nr:hypothetical protein [Gemmataceae bacterium]
MYEMVMMAAMTAGIDAPAFGRRRARGGCSGYVTPYHGGGWSGCGGYAPAPYYPAPYSGCGGFVPGGTVVHGGCCGTIISITPIEPGKGGDKPGPGGKLDAEEEGWLKTLLEGHDKAEDKKKVEEYYRSLKDKDARKKYFDEETKAPDVKLDAEEQGWLKKLLEGVEKADEKKKVEDYFKSLKDKAERKKYFDEETKMVEVKLDAEEQGWLKKLVDQTEKAEDKKKVEEYFKSLKDKAERKKYFEEETK